MAFVRRVVRRHEIGLVLLAALVGGASGVAVAAIGALVVLFVAKAVAASFSIGAGCRGGMFFASLLLGAVMGRCGSVIAMAIGLPGGAGDAVAWTLVGMASFATGVVGAPLAMTFLVVETTGGIAEALSVLPAVAVASLTVRRLFDYSFATWRFHLRGEAIRSARDLTWMNDLTVGRMMRRDVAAVAAGMPVDAFRRALPLGSATRVIAADPDGRYAGLVLVSEAHASAFDDALSLDPLLRLPQTTLTVDLDARAAMAVFHDAEAEALAVVDRAAGGRVVGLLTEAHLLRRYGEELEKQRRSETGLS